MKRGIFALLALIFLVTFVTYWDEITRLALIVLYTGVTLVILIALVLGFVGSWLLVEKVRTIRAARIEAEKHAHVMTITDNGETWVRDTDKNATWRNLTGTPALYVNGQQHNPQDWEFELYRLKLAAMAQTRTAAAQVIPGQAQLLPPPSEAAPLDLLTVFTQPTQAYAIIGGQQTGKTWQARHIAAYWLQQGARPVVIGPKWDKGEWAGCYLIGGGGDMAAVEWGINLVRRLVEQRHASTNTPHKNHPIQPVFFDDWTPIVDAVPNARALVLEATTLYASVNVLLYFILHSDTANAWGVDRKGAALKDNVVKLFIVPHYDDNGLILRNRTQGFIRFAGESIDRPARLFTTPPTGWGRPVIIAPPGQNTTPTPQEAAILRLFNEGHSYNEIARRLFGNSGGHQVSKIKQVLDKFAV